MKKVGVNDLCPCGSGKKYKKCYLLNSETCSLYIKEKQIIMIDEYEKVLTEVLDSLLRSTQELNQLFFKTKEGDEIISSRMQLIGIFTIIDVLGNYWYAYLGKTGKPSERFDDFINKFCFINENKEFSDRKYLQGATTEELRSLRDSVVHFYGLGKNTKYSILSNPSRANSQGELDSYAITLKKIKKDVIFIQPFEFKKIIVEGSILMLHLFKTEAENAKSDEGKLKVINDITRIQLKLREEGASYISPEMARKLSEKMSLQK
jgi:hypothetical protein